MKILTFDQSRCISCGACQVICSLVKKGKIQPSEARIHVSCAEGPDVLRVAVCQHCTEPVCVSACMRGIIDKDSETGRVTRRYEDCFRCAACKVMCPVGAIVLDHDVNAFLTCDLCGDDPVCAKICPTGALCFQDLNEASAALRTRYAQRALGEWEAEG